MDNYSQNEPKKSRYIRFLDPEAQSDYAQSLIDLSVFLAYCLDFSFYFGVYKTEALTGEVRKETEELLTACVETLFGTSEAEKIKKSENGYVAAEQLLHSLFLGKINLLISLMLEYLNDKKISTSKYSDTVSRLLQTSEPQCEEKYPLDKVMEMVDNSLVTEIPIKS